MSSERFADHIDLRKPFDGRHCIPSRNDDPQRVAMHDRESLPVHGVGKQHVRPLGVVHAQTPLKANWFATRIKFATVGTPKHHFSRARIQAGAVENLGEWYTGPFGSANGS